MIEDADIDRRVMREGQKRRARADAGPQDSDALVAFLFQPTHRRARVQHRLSHRLNRAADICADQMLGAFQIRRPALFVIRQRQAQRSHAETVEDTASLDVAIRLGVPLGQDNDGRARLVLSFAARDKQTPAGDVVFGGRSFDGAGPTQTIAVQREIADRGQRIKLFTAIHCARRVLVEDSPRIVAICVLVDELQAPFKRAHDSIVIAARVLQFTGAHPSSEQIASPFSKRPINLAQFVSVILKLAQQQNQASKVC